MSIFAKTYPMLVHMPKDTFTLLLLQKDMFIETSNSWITELVCTITSCERITTEEIDYNKTESYISQYFENLKDKLTKHKLLLSLVPKNTYQIVFEEPFNRNKFTNDKIYKTIVSIYLDNIKVADGFLWVGKNYNISFELRNKGVLTQPEFAVLYLCTFNKFIQLFILDEDDDIDDDESTDVNAAQKEITKLTVSTHTITPELIPPNCCVLERHVEDKSYISIYYDIRRFEIKYDVNEIYEYKDIPTIPKINRATKIEMSHSLVCKLTNKKIKQEYKIDLSFYDTHSVDYFVSHYEMGHIIHYLV